MVSPGLIELPILEETSGQQRQLGSLILSRGTEKLSLPLGSVSIEARVVNQIAQVTLKQVFKNTLTEHLEAVYIFPMAAGCAVSSFQMRVGERLIKGLVQERAEARRQYQEALQEGKRAALLEQERDDVFTVQLGNLPPGEEISIEISYSERLPFFDDCKTELRLPLVIAPRYIAGTPLNRNSVGDGVEADTDLVPDASRITPPRLASGVDPGTALKLKVEILQEKGCEIADLVCSQHANKTSLSKEYITVSLARVDERLNRDFVLRWRSAGDSVKSSLLTYKTEDGQTYGLLSVMPPARDGYLGAARDIVFVLDRSGSMNGVKMISAVRACNILLNTLGSQDRYAIAAFDNCVEWMPGKDGGCFSYANSAGIEQGEKYLRGINARGGTEMDRALAESLSCLRSRADQSGRLATLVVLTDGHVGSESQILHRIQTEIQDARLFVVGIDTAVNSGLLKRLANLGGGTAAFVEPGVQLEEALASIARDIGAPLVSDLQVEDLDLTVDRASLSPSRIPDLFAGRASISFLKLSGSGKLKLKGKSENGNLYSEEIPAQSVDMPSIAQLWAKAHIVDLEDQYRISLQARADLKKQIIDLSVQHQLLTKFTAFVVVDQSEIVNKTGKLHKVIQPVENPDKWDMESVQTGSFAAKGLMSGSSPMSGLLGAASMPAGAGGAAEGWGSADSWGAADFRQAPASAPLAESYEWSALQAPAPSAQAPSMQAPTSAAPPAPPSPPAPPARAKKSNLSAAKSDLFDQGSGSGGSAKRELPAEAQNAPEQVKFRDEAAASASSHDSLVKDSVEKQAESARKDKYRTLRSPDSAGKTDGALSNLLSKLSAFVQSLSAPKAPQKEWAPELVNVQEALSEFFNEFDSAFNQIEEGMLPDAAKLELLRTRLLQALAPTKLAMELPLLQRFLRASAIELVASLKDKSVKLNELSLFWKNKQEGFLNAKQELDELLSMKEPAFWDASI